MTPPVVNAKMGGTLAVAPAVLMIGLVMSDFKPPEFSRLVQEMRQRSGLTQAGLAARIGVSYYSINRWENQKTLPVSLALRRVEKVLHEMGDRGADLLEHYFPTENRE